MIEEPLLKRGRHMVSSTEVIWFSQVLLSERSVKYIGYIRVANLNNRFEV